MSKCIIIIVNSSSPEVISDALKRALADTDLTTAKQMVCDMGQFSECEDEGVAITIAKVVDVLIKTISDNPTETITNSQVFNAKQGTVVIMMILKLCPSFCE